MKDFILKENEIKQITELKGSCIASDRITVDGKKIGYMYRENPTNSVDSGWRFFCGDESDEYVNGANNIEMFALNTICNYDNSIISYLNAPIGSSFEKTDGKFEKIS